MSFLEEKIENNRVFLPPIDAGRLKNFGVVTMLIDHAAFAFLERVRMPDGKLLMQSFPKGILLDIVLRAVGRQAFPIFCFFLVEGFYHTRNRLRYLGRLLLFAAFSLLPFQYCLYPGSKTMHYSVLVTLALGFLSIWCIDEMWRVFILNPKEDEGGREQDKGQKAQGMDTDRKEQDRGAGAVEETCLDLQSFVEAPFLRRTLFLIASIGTVAGFCRLAYVLYTDYKFGGVLLIVIMYCLRKYRITSLFISWAWLSWYNKFEIYSLPAFLLLAGYNGKRGKQNKYFFYFFYPVHLLLLWLLRRSIYGY